MPGYCSFGRVRGERRVPGIVSAGAKRVETAEAVVVMAEMAEMAGTVGMAGMVEAVEVERMM